MAHKLVFKPDGDDDPAPNLSRLIGGIGIAYVVVLALMLVGGVLVRLHVDNATAAPVAPLGFRSTWSAFSA